jgi:hypothetical protein
MVQMANTNSTKEPLLSRVVGDLPVAICGLATALVVVLVDWLLKESFGFNFPSLMFWFVIPIGALVTGAAAASGYYFGAKLLHHMPTRGILVNMVLVGVSTWLMIHWTEWRTARFGGTGDPVADVVPFLDYWKWNTEHMTFSLRSKGGVEGNLSEMGSLGFWAEGLQVVGFLLGGAGMFAVLSDQRACVDCRRYYKSKSMLGKIIDGNELVALFDRADLALPDIAPATKARLGSKGFRGFDLVHDTCPGCGGTQLAFVVHYGRDESALVTAVRCDPDHIAALRASVPQAD